MEEMPITGTDSIIDLSHWNTVSDFNQVRESGVTAIIHKCSQGLVDDPSCESRCSAAHEAGLLVGLYHFGVQSQDPIKQADWALESQEDLVSKEGRTIARVIALDWEWNKADTMRADQATAFVKRVNEKTGRWPILYTSAAFIESRPWNALKESEHGITSELAACDLWVTGFSSIPVWPWPWSTWKIWQYRIGACAGITGQVDRDTFNGSAEELKAYFS